MGATGLGMNVPAMNIEPLARVTIDSSSLGKAAHTFATLSNEVRLGVLLRIIEREWSVNELAVDLELSQSALSQHLGKLRQARIVRARRNRQSIFYRCDDDLVLRLLSEAGLLKR